MPTVASLRASVQALALIHQYDGAALDQRLSVAKSIAIPPEDESQARQWASLYQRHEELAKDTQQWLSTRRPLQAGLTRRETDVLAWMAQGKTDKEIATILEISPRTTSQHVSSILKKLKVENRTAAVVAAQRLSGSSKSLHP